MIFQCHLTLAVAILIGPALPKVLVEKCYANKPVCEFSGVNGVKNGGQIYCWERCLCKGYARGTCEQSQECTVLGYPWTCTCQGKSNNKQNYEYDRCKNIL